MKSLYRLPLLMLMAGCGKPSGTRNPKPHWAQAGSLGYEHWECPSGYEIDYGIQFFPPKETVYCASPSDELSDLEKHERSLQPK